MDKDYWKYQGLLWRTAWKSFLEHFEGWKKLSEPLIIAILTFLLTIVVLFLSNGEISMNDWLVIAISTAGGPFIYIVYMFLAQKIFSSYTIFKNKESEFSKTMREKENEFNKILKGKELELEKYNWDNIEFWTVPYSIIGMSGVALRIKNKKRFALDNIKVEITTVRKDQNIISLSGKHQLGYIDSSNGQIGEKIIFSKGIRIGVGEYKDFVVTSMKQDVMTETHVFVTFPEDKDLRWPFPAKERHSLLSSSLISMTAKISALASVQPPESVVVIEIKITGEIIITEEGETNNLPKKTINLQVHSNGSLSFYNNKDEDENEEN